jgi:hypothetical protein
MVSLDRCCSGIGVTGHSTEGCIDQLKKRLALNRRLVPPDQRLDFGHIYQWPSSNVLFRKYNQEESSLRPVYLLEVTMAQQMGGFPMQKL